MDEPPLDLFDGLTADLRRSADPRGAGRDLRSSACDSGRTPASALLMPRPDPAKRTPLWLQRLRAKDLLQVVRQFPDFPIVLETCPRMPRRRPRPAAAPRSLDAIQDGTDSGRARPGEVPSPFTSELVFSSPRPHLYRVGRAQTRATADRPPTSWTRTCSTRCSATGCRSNPAWLGSAGVGRVATPGCGDRPAAAQRGRGGRAPASLGDLTGAELGGGDGIAPGRAPTAGRALMIELAGTAESPLRWIAAEDEPLYRTAFSQREASRPASRS